MTRKAQWITLATLLASFLVGVVVANAQQFYGPAAGLQQMMPHPMAMGHPGMMPMPGMAQQPYAMHAGMQMMRPPVQPIAAMPPMYIPPGVRPAAYQPEMFVQAPQLLAPVPPNAISGQLVDPPPITDPNGSSDTIANDVDTAGNCADCGKKASIMGFDTCGCRPAVTFGGSLLYMKRSQPDAITLVNSPAGTPVLDASQFDFDYETGYEFHIVRHTLSGRDIEARYMQIDGWNAGNAFNLPAGATGDLATNPPTSFVVGTAGATFTSTYSTILKSAELNSWQQLGQWTRIGAGVRWIGLEDQFTSIINPPPIATVSLGTQNNMYGFQLTGNGILWTTGRLSLELDGRAGIYLTESKYTGSFQQGTFIGQVTKNDWAASFAGEAGLVGVYQLTDRVALRAGYQAMWIEGVALATDQIDNTTSLINPPVQATLETGGGILAHGGVFTVEFSL